MSQPEEQERLSPETISVLVQLKETDQRVAALERELARQPGKLEAPRRQVRESEKAAAEAAEILTAAQKRIDSKSVESDSIQGEITKLENQLFSLKSTTEFDAMKLQIKTKKEIDDKLQTEVLELMEAISDLKEARDREKRASEAAKDELARVQSSVEDETAAVRKRLEEAQARRAELESGLPDPVREMYESVAARRGTGVAEVHDEICRGCDTRVTVQTLNAVMAHRLVQCPHCDRILYVTE